MSENICQICGKKTNWIEIKALELCSKCADGLDEKEMRYKDEQEVRKAINDLTHENTLSSAEKSVLNALEKVDAILRWRLYSALHDFIDKWLF